MDSLPEWVEKWIDENEAEVRHEVMYIDAIPTFKVRALLSHYRLCERESLVKLQAIEGYPNSAISHALYSPAITDRSRVFDGMPLYAEATNGDKA
jgi:hypothetical protein